MISTETLHLYTIFGINGSRSKLSKAVGESCMVGMRLPLQKTHARCAHERCETGRGMFCCTVAGDHPVVGVSDGFDATVADLMPEMEKDEASRGRDRRQRIRLISSTQLDGGGRIFGGWICQGQPLCIILSL